jgi:hypothetical protein
MPTLSSPRGSGENKSIKTSTKPLKIKNPYANGVLRQTIQKNTSTNMTNKKIKLQNDFGEQSGPLSTLDNRRITKPKNQLGFSTDLKNLSNQPIGD